MSNNDNKIEDFLRQNNIMPSYQRMKIYEYLIRYKSHPTVDEIYQALVNEIPTLSKTTVYNTLKLFLDKRIIQLITIEENENRYDADVSIHGHFKCIKCAKVYDVWLDMAKMEFKGLEEFNIDESHIYFKGTCSKCFANIKTN